MARISRLRREDEIALEFLREELRDQRWARRRSQFKAGVWALAIVVVATEFGEPDGTGRWLLRLAGY